jgi:hypothetical protein
MSPHQDPSLGTYSMVGGGGGALQTTPPPPPCDINPSTQHSCKDTNIPTHNRATTLVYIKLPMYLLFIWRLYLMFLRRATSLLGALEGVGPENIDLFGPRRDSHCHFRAQKSLDFQGPPLPISNVNDTKTEVQTFRYRS